jgi:copper ion binding protein
VKLARLAAAALALAALAPLPTRATDPSPAPAPAKAKGATATAVIPVKGMECGGCVSHVNEAVRKLDGVKSVDTDLDKASTTVVYDPARLKPEQIVAAIAETGYQPGTPKMAR